MTSSLASQFTLAGAMRVLSQALTALSLPTCNSFAQLLHRIASVPPQSKPRSKGSNITSPELTALRHWIRKLARPLHQRTGVILFRLLFPEKDSRRRYGLQETTLVKALGRALNLPPSAVNSLMRWAQPDGSTSTATSGCLGKEINDVLALRFSGVSCLEDILSQPKMLTQSFGTASVRSEACDFLCSSRLTPR